MPLPKPKSSLDEILSKRQFSVKSTEKGDALTKIYKAPASWDDENRSARFVMTAEVKDRYGDIVVAKGGDLADFMKNPVVLWGHNSRAYPIGMWSDVKTISGQPKRMEGTAELAPEGTTEQADDVARLLAANMVRACSIGFLVKEWEAVDKEDPWGGWRFLEWELLECSICSVPANPEALVKSAGGDTGLALQAIELVLDEWARTPEGLIVPRERYEKAYQIAKKSDATVHEVRSVDEEEVAAPAASEQEKEVQKGLEAFMSLFAKTFGLTPKLAGATEEPITPAEKEKILTPAGADDDAAAAVDQAVKDAEAEEAAREKAEQEEKERAEREAAEAEELANQQKTAELRARALALAS